MMNRRRDDPRALRFAVRRKREDDAPRLRRGVPRLASLVLAIEEREGALTVGKYKRRVVLDSAPALFLVACSNPECSGSEHDLTDVVMRAVLDDEKEFHGEDSCRGSVGAIPCARMLRFEGVATYEPAPRVATVGSCP